VEEEPYIPSKAPMLEVLAPATGTSAGADAETAGVQI